MRHSLIFCSVFLASTAAFAGPRVTTQSGVGFGSLTQGDSKKDFYSVESYVGLQFSTAKSNFWQMKTASYFLDLGGSVSRSITLDGTNKIALLNPRVSVGTRRDYATKEIFTYTYGVRSLPEEKVKYLELGLGLKSNMTLRNRVGLSMFVEVSGAKVEYANGSAYPIKGVVGTGLSYSFGRVTHCDNLFCY